MIRLREGALAALLWIVAVLVAASLAGCAGSYYECRQRGLDADVCTMETGGPYGTT